MSSRNADDGLMVDITEDFRRFPALLRTTARNWTPRYAMPKNTAPNAMNDKYKRVLFTNGKHSIKL